IALKVEVLVESGNAGISDKHVGIVNQQPFFSNRKPVIFSRQKRSRLRQLRFGLIRLSGKRSFFRYKPIAF
ncbi:hypothetical protein, partial [Methylobacterium sp. BTF04]|uniref:hypothetical protein n=1 Tax=Methylobacterium sp. BTF04 TaxID=2708300 RepID=UPI0019547386